MHILTLLAVQQKNSTSYASGSDDGPHDALPQHTFILHGHFQAISQTGIALSVDRQGVVSGTPWLTSQGLGERLFQRKSLTTGHVPLSES